MSGVTVSVESLAGKVLADGTTVCVGLRVGYSVGTTVVEAMESSFRWTDGCSALAFMGRAEDAGLGRAARGARTVGGLGRRQAGEGALTLAARQAISPYSGVYGSAEGPAPSTVNGHTFEGCTSSVSPTNLVVLACVYTWNSCKPGQVTVGGHPCHRWRAVAEAISYQNSTTMGMVARVYRGYEVVPVNNSIGVCETDIWTWRDPPGGVPNSFDARTGYRLDVSLDTIAYEPERPCLCTTAMVIFANTTTINVTVVTPGAVNGTANGTSQPTASVVTTTTTENISILPRTPRACSTLNCPAVTRKALEELPLPNRKDKLGLGGKIGALLGCGAGALLAGAAVAWLFLKRIGGPVTIKVEGMTLPELTSNQNLS